MAKKIKKDIIVPKNAIALLMRNLRHLNRNGNITTLSSQTIFQNTKYLSRYTFVSFKIPIDPQLRGVK